MNAFSRPPKLPSGLVHVVIDTPKGSRNKYKYDERSHSFELSRILPAGACFPHDFGSIPGTIADDGDALDVLVLCDTPSFVGCVITVRLIGSIAAEQTEGGTTIRNDRLVAVPVTRANPAPTLRLSDLPATQIDEIEHFFVSYNQAHGRTFKPIGRGGPDVAESALDAAAHRYRQMAKV